MGENVLQQFDDALIIKVKLANSPFLVATPGRVILAASSSLTQTAPKKLKEENHLNGEGMGPSIDPQDRYPEENSDFPGEAFGREKAAKNDDADVSTNLWDRQVWCLWHHDPELVDRISAFENKRGRPPLDVLRDFLLRRWRRNVWASFRRYMNIEFKAEWKSPTSLGRHSQSDVGNTTIAGRDCLARASAASWWDWEKGSRLFFWHWPPASRAWARDILPAGLAPWLSNKTARGTELGGERASASET